MTNEQAFYRHLDVCRQCREHPLDLCKLGAVLLPRAALEPTKAESANTNDFQLDVDRMVWVERKK